MTYHNGNRIATATQTKDGWFCVSLGVQVEEGLGFKILEVRTYRTDAAARNYAQQYVDEYKVA